MPRRLFLVLALSALQGPYAPAVSPADDRVYSISDVAADSVGAPDPCASAVPCERRDGPADLELAQEYPRRVCHHPGTPRKPLWDRPGDIDASCFPPIRYGQDDCFRAGWPHAIRKWATCSVNAHYSAWYVGGGAACIFPHAHGRAHEQGTWGLDYSLFGHPKRVWLKWTNGREQGGLGAYATDH